jgi:hypothetical protein
LIADVEGDLCEAFDKVPHRRLLYKPHYYGCYVCIFPVFGYFFWWYVYLWHFRVRTYDLCLVYLCPFHL